MNKENERLPDILRPTELHDFGDVFGATSARYRQHMKTVLAVLAAAALIVANLRLTVKGRHKLSGRVTP